MEYIAQMTMDDVVLFIDFDGEKCLSIDGLILRHHQCHVGLFGQRASSLVEEREAHVVIRT